MALSESLSINRHKRGGNANLCCYIQNIYPFKTRISNKLLKKKIKMTKTEILDY
jgi:hypothetical protein